MLPFTTRPEIRGTFGVAASTHWIASQVAMSMLEGGGNAFDAAVAGGFALQILEPHLNGPGGEVPVVFWSAKKKRVEVLCGQGSAPALADASTFRRMGLDLVPGIGLLPATVPGAFGAWLALLRDHGTMTLAQVLRPAIEYAQEGFPLVPRAVQAIVSVREFFDTEWKSSAAVWMPGGRVPRPMETFTNRTLANTYRNILVEAQRAGSDRVSEINAALDVWYRGFVARSIDAYYTGEHVRDTTGERNAGLLRFEDLAAWQPTYEAPVTLDFGRYTVAKCDAWSQGPVLLQQLAMLRHAGLDGYSPDSAAWVHRVAEACKLAMADRHAWHGDPDFVDVPMAQLLSNTYGLARWKLVTEASLRSMTPGSPDGRTPHLPDLDVARRTIEKSDTSFGAGEPTFANLPPIAQWADHELFVGDTCHIDVVDRHGNMVSATPSGGWLSSSPVIPNLGFSIGTRLQMTWLDDGVPGQVAPRKRPNSTLTPSLALRDGEPYLVFGTPGGDQQDQWSLIFFLRHALHGMNLQEAIDFPSWHVNHFPASFWPRDTTLNRITVESRFPKETVDSLRERGHDVVVGEPWSEGRLSACARERDSRGEWILKAAANPRGMQGYAVGR
ncbi:MAG: gamma-glutamyltransferase family protein [Burkholderiales bacterium]|nr:gamma-glutamyltransferase family protein [Burkholderiales bacterium]